MAWYKDWFSREEYALISATIVRDVHRWHGDVSLFVPPPVVAALEAIRKRP